MLESPDDSVSVEKAASNEMLNVLKYNAASDEASCPSAACAALRWTTLCAASCALSYALRVRLR